MIINIPGILQIMLIHVFRNHLKDIESSYKGKPWIKLFISYLSEEFNNLESRICFPNLFPAINKDEDEGPDEWHDPQDEEFFQLACDLKQHLDPADYLFLKACFAEKEEDNLFFMKQAHMIEPENTRLFIFSTMMKFLQDDIIPADKGEFIDQFNSVTKISPLKDVKLFTSLLTVLSFLRENDKDLPLDECRKLLGHNPGNPWVWYSLLYHLLGKKQLNVLEMMHAQLQKREDRFNPVKNHLLAMVLTALNRHDEALALYRRIEPEDSVAGTEFLLDFRYQYSLSLKLSGDTPGWIKSLRDIVFCEDFHDTYSDQYYEAVIDLARYYCETNQFPEAESVISLFESISEKYAEEVWGEDYLLLMAERSLYTDQWEKALEYYRRAFTLTGDTVIRDKIRTLERGLDAKG